MAKGHSERLSFHLGLPWLFQHNSHMDWSTGVVLGWGNGCSLTCFSTVSDSKPPRQPEPIASTSSEPRGPQDTSAAAPPPTTRDPDFPEISCVPPCYFDLKEVFSKALSPHRPYDLLPGTSPHGGYLYSCSAPEKEAMKKYINSSLFAGIICPSSSHAKTFCPCIDYRG